MKRYVVGYCRTILRYKRYTIMVMPQSYMGKTANGLFTDEPMVYAHNHGHQYGHTTMLHEECSHHMHAYST